MIKTILTTLALSTALSMTAATSTQGHKQFKPAGKPMAPSAPMGFNKAKTLNQSIIGKSNATIAQYQKPVPSAIKEVKYAADRLTPVFFSSSTVVNTASIASGDGAQSAALQFLTQSKNVLGVKSPATEFVLKSFEKDNIGFTHVKLSQTYLGLPVMGKELIVHFSPTGTTVTGRWATTPTITAPTAVIGDQAAIAKAVSSVTDGKGVKPMSAKEIALLKYSGPTSQLVLYPKDKYNDRDRWAYKITARTNFLDMYESMVDAQTGVVIHSNNISCTTGPTTTTLTDLNGVSQSIHTYQAGNGTYYMIDASRSMFNAGQSQIPDQPVGALWTVDAQGASSSNIQVAQLTSSDDVTWPSSATAASASLNGAAAYSYYNSTHGRNSIDGAGGTVISVINVTDDQGQPMDNAFWNGQLMAYGNGNVAFKPLAGGLDVAGHEMTHGVIQSTANMNYQDQSGALNESMADVFGVLIDTTNWTIGEQVVLPAYFPSGALRDLSNPHNGTTQGNNGWQPAIMSEYVSGTDDHGGVHTNSGITNYAFYQFATAPGMNRQKAGQVYYRALTKYLTTGSQFLDARIAIVQAAADLYGAAEIQAAKTAFDNVQIYDGTNTQPTVNNAVTGTDWIMLQATSGTNALYMAQPATPAQAFPLNTTFPLNNVSITDDGSYAYFVGPDYNVYSITTDHTNPVQTQLTTDSNWENVAVSRDGNKLALVTRYQDTSIYIYDGASQQFDRFYLFAPTFSQGDTATNGPVYADALDWDPTGEYVIYDEKNVINNINSTTEISYWDIGILDAWNKSTNTFGSGNISKLVNNLPDGVSIGNPVFSKNENNIVAFDVSQGSTNTFDIQAADINTGNIGTIFTGNSVPNVPSYSSADNNITFTSVDSLGDPEVAIQPLAADYIDGSGQATLFSTGAEWSVWFTIGTRANAQCAGLSANITAQGSTDYPLTSVVLDAGAAYNSYMWNTGETTETITVTTAGTYVVTVTSSNGCTLSTNPLTIGYPTGIHEASAGDVKIYPVPSSDKIFIDLMNADQYTTMEMTDITGRIVMSQPITAHSQQVDISGVDAGVYTIRLRDRSNTNQYTSRIVKE